MDTRFSAAIHTLILVAAANEPMTSEQIAASVGTNASYIRKITGSLKRAGIIESRQGVGGFALVVQPRDLSLLAVYQAASETQRVHVLDIHQNPNDECIVGRHIQPVLTEVFSGIEEAARRELAATTLADVMEKMRGEIADAEAPGGHGGIQQA